MSTILILLLVGFFLGKITKGKNLSLSKLSTWVLSTVIIFVYLNDHPVTGFDFFISFLINTIMMLLIFTFWRLMKPKDFHVYFLSTAFCNTGYVGYPMVKFFFGDTGLSKAVVFSVVHTIFMITLGVAVAGIGGKKNMSILNGLSGVFKLPWIYAMIIAFVMNSFGKSWRDLPNFIEESLSALLDSAIPIIIITIGVELSRIKPSITFLRDVSILTAFKLFLTPFIVLLLVKLMNIGSIMGKVIIIESAMPTAMTTVLVATEADLNPELVSMIVFSSTFLSFLTLPIWNFVIT